jgi:hypothetical protein
MKMTNVTTNTMTICRGLAALKWYDDRITREMTGNVFIGVTVGKGALQEPLIGSGSVDQQTKNIQSAFDSIESLIDHRQKIKAAIVVSNAKTLVTLGGKEMTVAEAIELKKSVQYKQQFLQVLISQFNQCNMQVKSQNDKLETAIDSMVAQVMGASDKGKVDTTSYEAVAVPQRNAKEAALLDPKNIAEKIKALTEEISLIETELDFVLSTSNAITTIEV